MRDPGAWTRSGPPEPTPELPSRRLAPRRLTQLIETGIRILRRHWLPLILAAALFGTLGLVISEVASTSFGDVFEAMMTTSPIGGRVLRTDLSAADTQRLGGAFALSMAATLTAGIGVTLASLVAAAYADGDYRGHAVPFRSAVAHGLRRAPAAIAAWLITTLASLGLLVLMGVLVALAIGLVPPASGGGGLGVLLALVVVVAGVVALVVLAVRWSLVPIVIALERVGPVQALRRAWYLTAENSWRTFALEFVVLLGVAMISLLLSTAIDALVLPNLGDASVRRTVQIALGVTLAVLTTPIWPVMLTALYFDLRVRRDGMELTLDPTP